jgi:hypothetical protein
MPYDHLVAFTWALEWKLSFNEVSMLEEHLPHLKRALGMKVITVHGAEFLDHLSWNSLRTDGRLQHHRNKR